MSRDVNNGAPAKGSRLLLLLLKVMSVTTTRVGCDFVTQSVGGPVSWSGAILMGPEELGAPTAHVMMTGAPAT